MEVNKLESKEVLVMLFGLPLMTTVIVLASIGVGHIVTTRSDRPTNVTVAAAQPRIDVNVPQTPAPQIHVSSVPPNIDVKIPQALPPTVNVSTPPAVVTVVHRSFDERMENAAPPLQAKPAAPVKAPTVEPAKEPAKNAAKDAAPDAPAKGPDAGKVSSAPAAGKIPLTLLEEDLTLDTLYKYAERYIESYCSKRNLDAAVEAKKWNENWKQSLEQSMRDNTDNDEQSYINRIVVAKRDCFDIEKASPEKVVEGCRIMLRYRDGQLAWLQVMKDAVTSEGMKKTLVFLSAGAK